MEFNNKELEILSQWCSMVERYHFLTNKDIELKEKILEELKRLIK